MKIDFGKDMLRRSSRAASVWRAAALSILVTSIVAGCAYGPAAEAARDGMISEDIGSVFQDETESHSAVEPGGRDFPLWR
jgi:hypothetical protein